MTVSARLFTRRTVLATAAAAALALQAAAPASAATSILFIGNSFTYGALTPSVMNYKPSSVTDLVGTNIGGVPALFKQMTVDAGLDYTVFLETQGGTNLDYHFQNRLALINKPWDRVVMHGHSNLDFDKPNDPGRISTWTGILGTVFRSQNPNVDISLTATWSRADLTYPNSPNSVGSPWLNKPITQMAIDVEKGYEVAKANNASFVSRINPVGLAWNYALTSGFADINPYNGIDAGKVNLWASDSYHASAYGYYLHALVVFGEQTGRNPLTLGFDTAARDLGFTAQQAGAMQAFAALAIAAVPEPSTWAMFAMGGGIVAWLGRRRRL